MRDFLLIMQEYLLARVPGVVIVAVMGPFLLGKYSIGIAVATRQDRQTSDRADCNVTVPSTGAPNGCCRTPATEVLAAAARGRSRVALRPHTASQTRHRGRRKPG